MTSNLQMQLDVLETLCEKMECGKLGIRGVVVDPNQVRVFPHQSTVMEMSRHLNGLINNDFILPDGSIRAVRNTVRRLACYIIFDEHTGDKKKEDGWIAQIRSDHDMQAKIINHLTDTFNHVFNGTGGSNAEFKKKYAVAVVMENIFYDELNLHFQIDLEIPRGIADRTQLPLTLALSQVWNTRSRTRGDKWVTNFLKLVKPSIAPGSLAEFEQTLTEEKDLSQFKKCMEESGVSD
jgi:hypothetical protein